MRYLAIALLLASAPANAESFVDFAGGLAIPVANDSWTTLAEASPKLEGRAGTINGSVGALFQLDWTPVQLDQMGGAFPGGSSDVSGQRFRFLVEGVFAQHVAPKLSLGARVGAGLDLAYGSYSVSFLGNTTSHSNWNAGVAFELAGGLWFDVGSIQLGGELALPIGYHSHKAENTMDIKFDYTSYDFDLLFNVRLRQH